MGSPYGVTLNPDIRQNSMQSLFKLRINVVEYL